MMTKSIQLFIWFWRFINPYWRRYLTLKRKFHFFLQVEEYGATAEVHPSVHFDHPVLFQGKGKIIIKENVFLGYPLAGSNTIPILIQPREPDSLIQIGDGTYIVNGCEFIARKSIIIGSNCRLGPKSVIMDSDFHGLKPELRNSTGLSEPIVIENNVWFGREVMVLKGVTIGKDAVIGARCLVSKNVPPGAITVGNPMKIIGSVYE